MQRDVVASDEHLARCFRVRGICVILQGGRETGTDIDDSEE